MSLPYRQFDNFLPRPGSVREDVISGRFVDLKMGSETYKRVQPRNYSEFNQLVELALGRMVEQRMSIVRLNYADELPNNAIHSDNECDTFAAVLYLNPPDQCQGGTAFWRHKETGLTGFNDSEIRKAGKSPLGILKKLEKDWNDGSKWEQTGMADMAFNRLIVYPCETFHSRFPFKAFGSTPADGRLIWCSFFSWK